MGIFNVGITGASGAVYARRLLEVLLGDRLADKHPAGKNRVNLMVTAAGMRVLREEVGFSGSGSSPEEIERAFRYWLGLIPDDNSLKYYDINDIGARPASGSVKVDAMVVIPCTMHTLSSIAHGASSNLLERSADVMLKEGRPLILAPRETPLNRIHLENMLKVVDAGAKVVPPMPAFYNRPQTIGDLVDFIVGRVLDLVGVEHNLYRPWST